MFFNPLLEEMKAILKHSSIWLLLGMQDIRLRYRRSTIGPFWITISTAVTILCMSFLYSHLFKSNLNQYFPYLATGIIGWTFIATLILESSNAFLEAENYLRNQESHLLLFIMRLLLRNSIVLAHNALVLIPIFIFFHVSISMNLFLFIPGALLIGINALCWGNILAITGTRFRDFSQIITSLVQVVFFVTPVMWLPEALPARLHWLVAYNPFNQMLNLIRQPLLGHAWSAETIGVVLLATCLGLVVNAYYIKNYKHRVVFWL